MVAPEDLCLSAYDYELPPELIAQTPARQREDSRLLVYQRQHGLTAHTQFRQIGTYLRPGDLLVLNDTRVFPARLFGQKAHTGTRFEFLLIREQAVQTWLCLAKNSKRIRTGYRFQFPAGVEAEVLSCLEGGQVLLKFTGTPAAEFWPWLEAHGEIPYPPYITARSTEASRYQTVFAQRAGSVAAPTAGLHFSPELLAQLQTQGVDVCYLTLHVGIGTFSPVRTEQIEQHQLHTEVYTLPATTAARLNAQRAAGQRIIAVGTTATRTLETVWRQHEGKFVASQGETDLFVYPGQTLGSIDALITNFHLPHSSLLMLVSAWIGRSELMTLYRQAVVERYRFYSFGDAMLLL